MESKRCLEGKTQLPASCIHSHGLFLYRVRRPVTCNISTVAAKDIDLVERSEQLTSHTPNETVIICTSSGTLLFFAS